MKKRLLFIALFLLGWMLFFIAFKTVFLLYHSDQTTQLSGSLIADIFWHGLRLDLSFSAYASAIPFLLVAFSTIFPIRFVQIAIKYYTYLVIILISFLCVVDLELFRAWGFRLDATPLTYLDTPNEMLASAGASPIFLLLCILVVMAGLFIYIYKKYLHPVLNHAGKIHIAFFPLFLLLTAALIIPIRGGLQLAPLNLSDAYFSQNNYANQAAINASWNFFNALSRETYDKTNPFVFMEDSVAKSTINAFYGDKSPYDGHLLKTDRPNVMLIIWESFTAKVTGSLGHFKNITPNFDQLTKEGILFSNFYASGDRSDKGIISILSGYPAQPTESIIKLPSKASKLPVLNQSFSKAGYTTSFYYGGELEFASIKAYLVNAGFNHIIGKDQFDKKDWNSKWGAHDHVVLNRIYEDMKDTEKPFFTTVFTLSSHEPFEVPMPTQIKGGDEESLFLNSLYYTDQSLGHFIDQLKKEPWYKNTLVIILADHGHRMPLASKNWEKEKFHIPMLWLGGALEAKDTVVDTYSSQTDLAATLLNALNLPANNYLWSRNIFNPQFRPFAQYAFNNGIGHISPNGYEVFDNVSKKYIYQDKDIPLLETKASKAYLQLSFQDYLNK